MSDKPRVFVSAVSSEFGQTRQDVANILTRLGFEPVLQDVFGVEAGDLRQMLREKIDACDGLIQIVGQAYGIEPPVPSGGFEPPVPDEEFGRVSYTQFEYLYARKKGKKTWLILTEPGFASESALDRLDLPSQPDHPDPKGFQAERRALQERYRERLQKGSDVWYDAADKTELALHVERLRNDLARLRKAFRNWQAAVLVLLLLVAGGVSWALYRLHHDDPAAKVIAAFSPELIRGQLEKSIREAYDRDAAEVGKLHDWKARQKALKDAEQARDQKLAQLDEFLGSITKTIASGQASPEFLELSRILQEQGVNAALDYLSSQESRLLDRASQLVAMRQREVRRTLAPLLKGVHLHVDRGDLAEAERLCEKLLAADPDWPEARDQHVWTMIARGDRALRYENLTAARQRFDSARTSAERLMQLDPGKPAWQRDLMVSCNRLGDVSQQAGRLDAARGFYQQALDIAKKLAAADPANAQAQRDLSISYEKLGEVSQQAGRLDAARGFYQQDLDICKKLAAADPANAQAQRDLSISLEKLGEVSQQAGRLDAARGFYQQDLDICKKLAAADPANAQAQRDLSVSYERLGDVSRQAGRLDAARGFYQQGLDIAKKLAAADPGDAQVKRDLSVSYDRLGDVSQQAGRLDAARGFYQQGLDIRKKLAAADPANAQAQRDLMVSHYMLAQLPHAAGDFEMAIRECEQGIAVLERMIAKGQQIAQSRQELAVLQKLLARCRQSRTAAGAWDELLQQPADKLPELLTLRLQVLAARRQIDRVAQAAEALAKLEPKAPNNLYNAACGYGVCAKLAAGWPGQGPFPPPKGAPNQKGKDPKSEQKYLRAAIDLLQAAVKAGFKDFSLMQKDPDLAALCDLPEFKKLLAATDPRGH